MPNFASFLADIARNPDDRALRAVFADWLEDGPDPARAAFVRVQEELASADATARPALEEREYALLDAHRRRWIEGVGVPVVDVTFAGGVITAARLAAWEDGRVLRGAPELAAVTELDLSDLEIGDAALESFAAEARLPALQTLRLSGNDLTDRGVMALASAPGLPGLRSATLFDNAVTGAGREALQRRWASIDVDLGEPAAGYAMTRGQADAARRAFVRSQLWPQVVALFEAHPLMRSAMLGVAQYWADEADDAVHGCLVLSERLEQLETTTTMHWVDWDSNGGAITEWAAFAEGDGSEEVYRPAVLFHRHGGHRFYPPRRPHLDGVAPEWR